MRIQILSVIFIACKVAKCKGKNADCERKIIRKKPPSLARLSGNSAAFLPAKQLAYRARKQPQMRRSAVELRRSHSFIPLKAASIPAKNRLGSMKNSFKKQGRCCKKRDRFSLKTVTFFVQFSQQLISKKEGTAASEPPKNFQFLIKKSGEHAAGNARKI